MTTSHRGDGTPPRPGYPPRRQTSARSNGALAKMGLWGIGSFLGGLVALIAAIIIHDHAAYPNMLCNTGLGQLGQVFDNTVRVDCGVATTAESVVGWLVALGVVCMVGGLGKMVLGLAGGIVPPVQPSRTRPPAAAAQAPGGSTASPASSPAPTQAPYGMAPAPYSTAPAPYGYAAPAAMPPSIPRPVRPPAGPVMPERPATWAPPPPPPGSASPFSPEA